MLTLEHGSVGPYLEADDSGVVVAESFLPRGGIEKVRKAQPGGRQPDEGDDAQGRFSTHSRSQRSVDGHVPAGTGGNISFFCDLQFLHGNFGP